MSEAKSFVIDGKRVTFTGNPSILEVAKKEGIYIPTLCAFAPLNHQPGTCRMCLVEVTDADGKTNIVTSCTTPAKEGITVCTKSPEVRRRQRLQLDMVFADHDQDCKSCVRHGDCELQDLSVRIGYPKPVLREFFRPKRGVDSTNPCLTLDADKCIRCGRCVEVCRQIQGIGALTIKKNADGQTAVGFTNAQTWGTSPECISCGQCTLVCPVGALAEKDDIERVLEAIDDQDKTVVFQMAPAVRVALGEEFGLTPGVNVEKKIVTVLKGLGADYVMDTNFAADMVIMEEGTELLERIKDKRAGGNAVLPMFTSCCPAWVNHVEKTRPHLMASLSSTRSPQAVFGALAKAYLPEKLGCTRENLVVVSIMPCTAKKGEAMREELKHDGMDDVDIVITVRELARLVRQTGADLKTVPETEYDTELFTTASGAGAIFGTTGGVMEAAIRTAYALTHGGESLKPVVFSPVRGLETVKATEVDLGELGTARIAVVHGIAATDALLAKMGAGEVAFDFVEVMACPGGCISGGGTPRRKNAYGATRLERQEGLYTIDDEKPIRESHKNPQVIAIYEEKLGHPGSHVSHELLHCGYTDRVAKVAKPSIVKLFKH